LILNAPVQELVAQILFWGAACALPLGMFMLIAGIFKKRSAHAFSGIALLVISVAYWYYFANHFAG